MNGPVDEDEAFTWLSVRIRAVLSEYVKPPDRWKVRRVRIGPDSAAPTVLLFRISHPFRDDVFHINEWLTPVPFESWSNPGIEGVVRWLATHWQTQFKQAELDAQLEYDSGRGRDV